MNKIIEYIKNFNFKNFFKRNKSEIKDIELEILGISYYKGPININNGDIYIAILGEVDGERKIPVVLNYSEAQSIAIEVEKIKPAAPFIYDTMKEILNKHKIKYEKILISEYKNEILLTHLVHKKEKILIRVSDAMALSLRLNCPMYIHENVLDVVDTNVKKYYDIKKSPDSIGYDKDNLDNMSIEQLNKMLQDSIDIEEYEKSSQIRDVINKKKEQNHE